ncbi:isoprenyl transferase [Candidatus Albibeggiatoa sp. nov. BB20]|uniref:isoprenyl transferase n=1 Tax=Candidatus Albibeggiatoa sp. nov. BB20 TaxID=3162723 RepID=UPI003365314E
MSDSQIPRHVAIILDGNGRWAKKRFLPRIAGHKVGLDTVKRIVRYSAEQGIEALTLFAFSSENSRRPKDEVGMLFKLFLAAVKSEVQELHKNNAQLRVIGDKTVFPAELQLYMEEAEQMTRDNTGIKLTVAANYGGRWDISHAVQLISQKIERGELSASNVNEDLISQHVSTQGLPEPDLFIRTGGETRISNFLLWQLAYTEMYFTDTLWPDFDEKKFRLALDSYAKRERRYGRTSEQVTKTK